MTGSPNRLRFDGVVTAGNVLTGAAMMSTVLVWGLRLEGRVDHTEDLRARNEVQFREGLARVEKANDDVAGKIQETLRRLEDKLDRQIERAMAVPARGIGK